MSILWCYGLKVMSLVIEVEDGSLEELLVNFLTGIKIDKLV